jgi:hypothetical protein
VIPLNLFEPLNHENPNQHRSNSPVLNKYLTSEEDIKSEHGNYDENNLLYKPKEYYSDINRTYDQV